MVDALLQAAPWWAWGGFHAFVFLMLTLDLGVFNRKIHAPSMREAGIWSAVWITLALIFNAVIFQTEGTQKGLEWFTGYVLEKSLSVDNLFVFVLVFQSFQVDLRHQHRVLFWGVLGALVMRAAMILAGTALLNRFEWMMYVFGGFLLYTGVKMLLVKGEDPDPTQNPMVRAFRRFVPYDERGGHEHFWSYREGRRFATPMLLVLITIEVTDLVFAVDSIPAVLAVSRDPFVVYTSNIFAILGLRSLYFLLAKMMDRFHRLKTGLAMVLAFVGVKMCVANWVHIPVQYSLLIIAAILAGSVVASLAWPAEQDGAE
ncbi:TerC family protein [Geothrix alkalitolerans]|uniref:TerC family protein n=1 Tax=Geothrix alkalitolerans TaxID=2922724 RepID=UPI001FAE9203|nr:TerC family protein [Geothrix alkalitolerans]